MDTLWWILGFACFYLLLFGWMLLVFWLDEHGGHDCEEDFR